MQSSLKNLTSALEIRRQVVGVKFLADKKSFELANGKLPYNKMPYCVMVKVAMSNVALKITLDNLSCRGARNVMGLTEPMTSFMTGESGKQLGLYCDENISQIAASNLTRINNKSYGIQIMPLQDFIEEPDVVIIVTSPYNLMRISQGYSYHYGIKKTCSISGNQAFCSELTAEPYVNGEVNFSMLCSGTRFWCGWSKDEMGIGIPYKCFNDIVDGVMNTLNATEPLPDKLRIAGKFEEKNISVSIDTSHSYYYVYKNPSGSEK